MSKEENTVIEVPSSALAEPVRPGRLVQFLDEVNEKDLETLRAEIVRTEVRLAGMKKMEEVVAARLGKLPQPRTYKKKAAETPAQPAAPETKSEPSLDDVLDQKRRRVVEYLKDGVHNGQEIMRNCGVSPTQLSTVMTHSWFAKTEQGYHITPLCRRELF